MKCSECGSELEKDAVFCGVCNAEVIANETSEPVESNKINTDASAENKKSLKKKNSEKTIDLRKKIKFAGITAVALFVVIAIIIIIVNIVSAVKANEGRKLLETVPLGRDIEIIESDTKREFEDVSAYGAVGHIADFDYICESDESVVVGGITVPEWAVILDNDYDGTVNRATLMNFNVIEHNWMGEKTVLPVDLSTVEFRMTIKKAERVLGMKPYTVKKESIDNTSTYIYRYHYVDNKTKNTIVKNLYVTVDDAEDKVIYTEDKQVDYMKLILGAE